jgi:hypothetical protein
MAGSYAVLQSGMIGPWKNKICKAQLMDPMEPLDLGSFYKLQKESLELDRAVDSIMDYLEIGHGFGKLKGVFMVVGGFY